MTATAAILDRRSAIVGQTRKRPDGFTHNAVTSRRSLEEEARAVELLRACILW